MITMEKQKHSPKLREKGDFLRGLCSPRVDVFKKTRLIRHWFDKIASFFIAPDILSISLSSEWQSLEDGVCWAGVMSTG